MRADPRLPAALALAWAAVPGTAAQAGESAGLFAEGRPLPALELPTLDRSETIDLGALGGRRILLLQFASW